MQQSLYLSKKKHCSFSDVLKPYIIFNTRKGIFELLFGIPNEYLVKLITSHPQSECRPDDDAFANVRNCFSLLNRDGTLPLKTDLSAYRGKFTPEFYPMRFQLKDAIYQQHLEVLSILLNSVCARYADAGVLYVEFSLGYSDLFRLSVWKSLLSPWTSLIKYGQSPLPNKLSSQKKKNRTLRKTTSLSQLQSTPLSSTTTTIANTNTPSKPKAGPISMTTTTETTSS